MQFEDGLIQADSVPSIQQAMMDDAKDVWTDDLNDDELATIFLFYTAVSRQIIGMQESLVQLNRNLVLEHATGKALDYQTEQIGVVRRPATRATGEVTFSRDSSATTDYLIPEGTVVQTDALNPIRFETTDSATISQGTSSVSGVPVRAQEGGAHGNVGSNTLVIMPDPPTGVQSVTNPNQTSGGVDRESDDNLRSRAQDELSNGMRATTRGLETRLLKTDGVISATVKPSEADTSTECVVEGGTDQDVAQTIFDTKAAAEGTHGGTNGTSVTVQISRENGETEPITFSRPQTVTIYVDTTVATDGTFAGQTQLKDNVVQYIGGILSSADEEAGDLKSGDDVIYTKVMQAILNTEGVTDVPSLNIGTSSSPTGTSNISIASTEVATTSVPDGNITVTEQ